MLKEIQFKKKKYKLVLTKHALERMQERDISRSVVEEVIQSGKSVKKSSKDRWWVYKKVKGRIDNDICLSISIESPNLSSLKAGQEKKGFRHSEEFGQNS